MGLLIDDKEYIIANHAYDNERKRVSFSVVEKGLRTEKGVIMRIETTTAVAGVDINDGYAFIKSIPAFAGAEDT